MKKIFLALLVIVSLIQACKSMHIPSSEVPATITSAFNTTYPNATDVKWEKETTKLNAVYYKARFKSNNMKGKAKFDANGHVVTD